MATSQQTATLRLRVSDWTDVEDEEGNYYIQAFGRLQSGESGYVQVSGFRPYFYLRVPATTHGGHLSQLKQQLVECMWDREVLQRWTEECEGDQRAAYGRMRDEFGRGITSISLEDAHDFMAGFENGKKRKFAKVTFRSARYMNICGRIWSTAKKLPRLGSASLDSSCLYESNVLPVLRFLHVHDLDAAGILEVSKYVPLNPAEYCYCKKAFRADAADVKPCRDPAVQIPLLVAAWDIECYNGNQEFPRARQTHRGLARQFLQEVASGASWIEALKTLLPKQKFKAVQPAGKLESLARMLANLPGMRTVMEGTAPETVKLQQLEQMFNSAVPAVQGDPIIQIGLVVRSSNAMDKTVARRIWTLGNAAAWPDKDDMTEIICCETEEDMIRKFCACVREDIDPDVLCGYNDFGFDYKYLWDRSAELLGASSDETLVRLNRTRPNDGQSRKETKKVDVASGQFDLEYVVAEGRLQIDMLVVMRREHNLDSYKLDNVSSHFIRGAATPAGTHSFKTNNLKGIKPGDYIKFELMADSATSVQEHRKFQVASVDAATKTVTLVEPLPAEICGGSKGSPEWTLAKDDLPPLEIFRCQMGTDEDRGRVAKYCLKDCDLVIDIMAKLDILTNAAGMANVCSVPPSFLYLRGQGIKSLSLVARECRLRGQVVRVVRPDRFGPGADADEPSYEGAIVLDPQVGMYLDEPIAVGDFNSLYPNSIISENLSHDSWVWTKTYDLAGKVTAVEGSTEFEDVPGITYSNIEFDLKDKDGNVMGRKVCRFAQPTPSDADPNSGLGTIPLILKKLLAKRKETRKEMEKTSDDFYASVLNGLQLAYKVTANSMYGQLGSRVGPVGKIDLAACTTAIGREQILKAKAHVESNYDAKVIYGDSVTGDTPMFLRRPDGIPVISRFDELVDLVGGTWNAGWHGTKESVEMPEGWMVWSDAGWTRLERIIRHKLAPGKRMFRVLTHTGVVDVTEDHSLLRSDGSEVSPKDVAIGTSLKHHDIVTAGCEFPMPPAEDLPSSVDEAWSWGFLMADGCANFNDDNGASTLQMSKQDLNLILRAQKGFPFKTTIKTDPLGNNVLYAAGNKKGERIALARKFKRLFYNLHGEKIVPYSIINGPLHLVQGFWEGFYAGDGAKRGQGTDVNTLPFTPTFTHKGKHAATGLTIIARRLGYKVAFNERSHKPDIFDFSLTKGKQRCVDIHAIKRMYEISTEGIDYVYDCTSENHHFHVGPGSLIVHNTDSIMVKFLCPSDMTYKEKIEYTMGLIEKACGEITSLCKRPQRIEAEKIMAPFVLLRRKGYIGLKYDMGNSSKCKRLAMGVVLKRRDNCDLVKDVYGGALDIIMKERDIKKAQAFVAQQLTDLMAGKIPLDKLVITKSLRDDYKAPDTVPHAVLAKRMGVRDPGNKPQVGDRIPYVFVENPSAKLQGDKIEHVDYVREHAGKPGGPKVDWLYYITNQVQNPVSQLFKLVIEDLDGWRKRRGYFKSLQKNLIANGEKPEAAARKVDREMEAELERIMFTEAPHLKHAACLAANAGKGQASITSFFPSAAKKPKVDPA